MRGRRENGVAVRTEARDLAAVDPDVARILAQEEERQQYTLAMIASENYASLAVRQAQASVLTNKYSEGYPGRRYYQGNALVDEVEALEPEFRAYAAQIVRNAQALAAGLTERGLRVVSGGTDNHLVLVDLTAL